MKKIMLITGLGITFILPSCKKDWDCQCTDQSNNVTNHDIQDETLLNARSKCKSMNSSTTVLGVTASETCSLQ